MAAPKSINEELADRALSRSIDLLRFDASARREILGFLRRLEVRLEDRIRALRAGTGDSAAIVSGLRLAEILGQVQDLIATEFGRMAEAHAGVGFEAARLEARATLGGFQKIAITAELGANLPSAAQLRAIASNVLIDGAPSREWWSRQAGDLLQRFSDEIREGVALGETTDDLVRRVRGRATGKRHTFEINGREQVFVEFTGGLMDTSTRHAEALVRTSVQTIAGAARRSTFEENQDVVKGVVQISTLDTRTTVTCLARAGKAWSLPDYQPIDHDIAYAGGVPLHWNAIPAGERVLTALGELPIEQVRVGDFVVTHRGRYRRVYATMSKPGGPLPLVGIEAESGRILWTTQEHPVLTVGRGWQRADQVRAGDELLEHPEQAMKAGLRLRGVLASEDRPTLFEEGSFFDGVSIRAAEVPLAVHFESDHRLLEGEVDDVPADRLLEDECNARSFERSQDRQLVGLWVGSVELGERYGSLFQAGVASRRVAVAEHPGAVNLCELGARLGVPSSPVSLTARPVDLGQREQVRGLSISELDTESLASSREGRLAESESALNRADAFAASPVRSRNQSLDLLSIGKAQALRHWHVSKVRRVIVSRDTRAVYNLAVAEDETYLVSGLVVHNCRSTEAPLLKSWEELGFENLRDAPRGVRWSRLDGDVPGDFTMDDFLDRRSDEVVDEMLGPGVAELWRAHDLDLDDLINKQTGRPLTVAELEARWGAAA